MYSSLDRNLESVDDKIVNHASLLWLNNILDQQKHAGYDIDRWANFQDLESTSEQCRQNDKIDTRNGQQLLSRKQIVDRNMIEDIKDNPRSNANSGEASVCHGNPLTKPKSTDKTPQRRKNKCPFTTKGQRTLRTPHKLVERRYRNNLNAQIDLLANALPKTTQGGEASIGLEMFHPKFKSKAEIMMNAISYIGLLEESRVKSDVFVKKLRGRIAELQKASTKR